MGCSPPIFVCGRLARLANAGVASVVVLESRDGERCEFGPVGNSCLRVDARQVALHRLPSDEEPFGDFSVGEAADHQLDNTTFGWAQAFPSVRGPPPLAARLHGV